jgi:hypothetical protein
MNLVGQLHIISACPEISMRNKKNNLKKYLNKFSIEKDKNMGSKDRPDRNGAAPENQQDNYYGVKNQVSEEKIDEIVQVIPAIAGGLARAAMAGGSLAARAGTQAARIVGQGAARGARVVGQGVRRAGTAAGQGARRVGGRVARSAGGRIVRKVGSELGKSMADGAGQRESEIAKREAEVKERERQLELSYTVHKQIGSIIGEACWKGYEKKGMKTMFGKRYPNCVKKKRKLRETMEQISEEGLRAWFGNSRSKGGKPGWVQVVSGKPCARQPGQKSTPKCVSSSKRASMSKSERASAQRRKRAADPGQPQKSGAAKPTYVPTDKPKRKSK